MSQRFSSPSFMRIDEVIAAYDGIMPSLEAVMTDRGISALLPEPNQPKGLEDYVIYSDNGDPIIPDDLTEVDHVSIGKLFTFFTSWTNYVQSMLTDAEVSRDIIKAKLQVLQRALFITYQQDDPSLSDKRAQNLVHLDHRYVQADASYMEAYALAKTISTRYEQFKRSEKVISRELTRRQQELEAQAQGGQRGPMRPFVRQPSGRFSD